MRQVDGVLFDYGGVLTGPVKRSIAGWMADDRIDPDSFSTTLKAWLGRDAEEGTPIHRLETGALPVEEFETIFARELRTVDGSPVVAQGILGRLFAGMRPDPEMFMLVEDLRALDIRVGVLSNSWGNIYPRARIDDLFDVVVISGEVGLRKPHAAVYELALDRLGVPADRAVFVDDAEPNVLGAHNVGIRARLHADPTSTRAELADLISDLHRHPTGATA